MLQSMMRTAVPAQADTQILYDVAQFMGVMGGKPKKAFPLLHQRMLGPYFCRLCTHQSQHHLCFCHIDNKTSVREMLEEELQFLQCPL